MPAFSGGGAAAARAGGARLLAIAAAAPIARIVNRAVLRVERPSASMRPHTRRTVVRTRGSLTVGSGARCSRETGLHPTPSHDRKAAGTRRRPTTISTRRRLAFEDADAACTPIRPGLVPESRRVVAQLGEGRALAVDLPGFRPSTAGPKVGERAVALMPDARLEVLPGGHAPFLDDPERCRADRAGLLSGDFSPSCSRACPVAPRSCGATPKRCAG